MFRSVNKLILALTAVIAICGCTKSHNWHFSGVNIAEGQRTVHGPGTYNRRSSGLAVDGDTTSTDDLRSCSHTGTLPDAINSTAFWTVFLDGLYVIKGIRIYHRDGEYRWRRHKNFKIIGNPNSTTIYDDETARIQLYNQLVIEVPVVSEAEFNEITFKIPPQTEDEDDGMSMVTLCEVQIYSVMNDCHVITPSVGINWEITPGTGFIDTANQFVSSGSVVEFHCPEHARMKGEASTVCLSNGNYSHSMPQCIAVEPTVGSTASAMRFGLDIPVLAAVLGAFVSFADGMEVMHPRSMG